MNAAEQKRYLPGYRGIIRDISEAGGSLCRIEETIDEHGIERLIEVIDLGMVLYQAGDAMFVPAGDFRIYAELAARIEAGDDEIGETEPMTAAAE